MDTYVCVSVGMEMNEEGQGGEGEVIERSTFPILRWLGTRGPNYPHAHTE